MSNFPEVSMGILTGMCLGFFWYFLEYLQNFSGIFSRKFWRNYRCYFVRTSRKCSGWTFRRLSFEKFPKLLQEALTIKFVSPRAEFLEVLREEFPSEIPGESSGRILEETSERVFLGTFRRIHRGSSPKISRRAFGRISDASSRIAGTSFEEKILFPDESCSKFLGNSQGKFTGNPSGTPREIYSIPPDGIPNGNLSLSHSGTHRRISGDSTNLSDESPKKLGTSAEEFALEHLEEFLVEVLVEFPVNFLEEFPVNFLESILVGLLEEFPEERLE